ncbi:MAG: hypothetical protein Q8907_01955 [Bacteroidota bacterium]|nr:hypothetical protein [Bacteroidota bacterium]MDP4225322.1 hypothetical protein [Bacteroidota bacterium]MDP4273021.1 hypothetical protein [Bacteroidota bacterium]
MKKLIIFGSIMFFLASMFISCEPAIEENIGNSYILMSRSNMTVTFTDTLTVYGTDTLYNNLKDTTFLSVGVYQSGLSATYPEVDLKVMIDSVYLYSLIQQANDPNVPDVQKSSLVLAYKNAKILPASCYQFTPDVKIEAGKLVGNVNLVVSKSKFAKLKLANMFLPIAIDTTSVKGVNKDKAISVVQFKNAFVIKKL